MMKKIVAAASVLAVTGAIAMPAPAPAADASEAQLVACPNGVWECVEAWVDWTGDTAGHATYTVCKIVFGPNCAIPQP